MLPAIYSLFSLPVAGFTTNGVSQKIQCPACKQITQKFYKQATFVYTTWPHCHLITAQGGDVLLASNTLVTTLAEAGATGYALRGEVSFNLDSDFKRTHPEVTDVPPELTQFQQLVITGQADGPWRYNKKISRCETCDQWQASMIDFKRWQDEQSGKTPFTPQTVFTATWQGDDFFYLTEPGPPLITAKIEQILAKLGDLRLEALPPKQKAFFEKQNSPYAQRLKAQGWQTRPCAGLQSAGWVEAE